VAFLLDRPAVANPGARHADETPRGRSSSVLELADRLLPLLAAGRPVAVATGVDVVGSAPHPAGTSMAVTEDGRVVGAVSGGCVEDAALRDCRALLAGGAAGARRFGFGDEAAGRAGLACGGELDVLVHLADGPGVADELRAARDGRPAAVALVTTGPAHVVGRLVTARTVETLAAEVPGLSASQLRAAIEGRREVGRSGPVEVACEGAALRLFVDVAAPAPRLFVGGATETAVAVSAAAAAVGYRVTVCDPRAAFADAARFPAADRVLVGRLHEVLADAAPTARDAVCVLSHDEDLDPLALAVALESPAGHVGALGSRSTTARRREQLRRLGVPREAIERLRMPIGLDLGARTPQEVAVAVVAELLAARAGTDGAPLTGRAGPVHRALAR
jgi:xanthine dehydrogenase accessory factor